jgi:hypothetical protein
MGVLTALTITASRIFSLFVKNPFVLVKFLAAISENATLPSGYLKRQGFATLPMQRFQPLTLLPGFC